MELGTVVTVSDPILSEGVFSRARECGFGFGQVDIAFDNITSESLSRIAGSADSAGFEVIALGTRINPMRFEDDGLPGGKAERDFIAIAQHSGKFAECRAIVVWSGTLAKDWLRPTLLNHEKGAVYALASSLGRMLEVSRPYAASVLLRPCFAHVVHDPDTCDRALTRFRGTDLGIALDPAYLVNPVNVTHLDEAIERLIMRVGPRAEIAYVTDLKYHDTIDSFDYLLPGHGSVNYEKMMAAFVKWLPPDIPLLMPSSGTADVAMVKAAHALVMQAAERAAQQA